MHISKIYFFSFFAILYAAAAATFFLLPLPVSLFQKSRVFSLHMLVLEETFKTLRPGTFPSLRLILGFLLFLATTDSLRPLVCGQVPPLCTDFSTSESWIPRSSEYVFFPTWQKIFLLSPSKSRGRRGEQRETGAHYFSGHCHLQVENYTTKDTPTCKARATNKLKDCLIFTFLFC